MNLERTEALLGDLTALKKARVIVFGIGGVGGYCAEALARSGVGYIALCDGDNVTDSNINRQIIALNSTLGRNKSEVMAERISDINSECQTEAIKEYVKKDSIGKFNLDSYDYIADCIDTVTDKIALIEYAKEKDIPIISCMGAGNKIKADFKVADISKTKVCPLARIIRAELRKRGIESGVKVVYSEEEPVIKRRVPASVAFVPPVAGLLMAGEIIGDILKKC